MATEGRNNQDILQLMKPGKLGGDFNHPVANQTTTTYIKGTSFQSVRRPQTQGEGNSYGKVQKQQLPQSVSSSFLRKQSMNSQRRLQAFKYEWQGLLDSHFTQKAPDFNSHYSSVIGKTIIEQQPTRAHAVSSLARQSPEVQSWLGNKNKQVQHLLARNHQILMMMGEQNKQPLYNQSRNGERPILMNLRSSNSNNSRSQENKMTRTQFLGSKQSDRVTKLGEVYLDNKKLEQKKSAGMLVSAASRSIDPEIQMLIQNQYNIGIQDYKHHSYFNNDSYIDETTDVIPEDTRGEEIGTGQQRTIQNDYETATRNEIHNNDLVINNSFSNLKPLPSSFQQKQRENNLTRQSNQSSIEPKIMIRRQSMPYNNRKNKFMKTYLTQSIVTKRPTASGSLKTKKTNISVIDQYYADINRQEDLEQTIYQNEFNRVFSYIKMLWRNMGPSLISQDEQKLVLNQISNSNPIEKSRPFLTELNMYLKHLQALQQSQYILKSLYEERQSFIRQLRVCSQTYNPTEFLKNGVKYVLKLRDITIKLIRQMHHFLGYYTDPNFVSILAFPKNDENDSHECIMCQMFIEEKQYIPQLSTLMNKLSFFVNDTVFFQPKTINQVLYGLKSTVETQKFQQILEMLQIDPFSKQSLKIKECYDLYRAHNCPPKIQETTSMLLFQWQFQSNMGADSQTIDTSFKSRLQEVYHLFSSSMKNNQNFSPYQDNNYEQPANTVAPRYISEALEQSPEGKLNLSNSIIKHQQQQHSLILNSFEQQKRSDNHHIKINMAIEMTPSFEKSKIENIGIKMNNPIEIEERSDDNFEENQRAEKKMKKTALSINSFEPTNMVIKEETNSSRE